MPILYEIKPDLFLGGSAEAGSVDALDFKRGTTVAPPDGEGPFMWNGKSWVKPGEDYIAPSYTTPERRRVLNITQLGFLRLLTASQVGRWERRKKAALEATTPSEMDDVVLQGDRLFSSTPSFNLLDPISQAVVYVMYVNGVFGPFFDGTGTPTQEQLDAIAEADRVAAGEPISEPAPEEPAPE